jgi:hypothetical protein
VSRFGEKHIQMNFAENQNAAASPTLAASPSRLVGGPARGPAKVHARVQGRRGAGFGGDPGALGRAGEGGRERRRQGQVQRSRGPEGRSLPAGAKKIPRLGSPGWLQGKYRVGPG